MALTGHSGMHTAQSMHSSGSMVRMFGPSRKQSTGQTSTQSVYLQRMHDSRTTWVIAGAAWMGVRWRPVRRQWWACGRRFGGRPGFYGDNRASRGRGSCATPARGCGALATAAAPAPTVTTVGRPACSTAASASVATRWSLCSWSGQPARETTQHRRVGRPAGLPAGGATARRAGARPCRRPRCRRCARPAARRSRVIAVRQADAAAAAAARQRALRGGGGGDARR